MRSTRKIGLPVIIEKVLYYISKILNKEIINEELSFKSLQIGSPEKQLLLKFIKEDEILKCDLITEIDESISVSFAQDIEELVNVIDETLNGEASLSSYGMFTF